MKSLNEELRNLNFEDFIDIEDENIDQKFKKFNDLLNTQNINKESIIEFFEKKFGYFLSSFKDFETFYFPHKLKRIFDININAKIFFINKIGYGPLTSAKAVSRQPQKKNINAISTYYKDEEAYDLISLLNYVLNNKGLAKGKKILDWIEEKIKSETRIQHLTLAELSELHNKNPKKYKQLYVIGTNLSNKRSEVFSNEKTPNVIISDAVRISMSLPGIFQPHVRYEKKDNKRQQDEDNKDLYIDGGIMDNYPIWLFDDKFHKDKHNNLINPETLGFRLESLIKTAFREAKDNSAFKAYPKNDDKKQLRDGFSFVWNFVGCFLDKQDSDFDMQIDKNLNRTIFINHMDVPTFKFNLSNEEKKTLIAYGQNAASKYLKDQKNLKDTSRDTDSYMVQYWIIGGSIAIIGSIAIKILYNN